jgi:Transposase DDE domain group 1
VCGYEGIVYFPDRTFEAGFQKDLKLFKHFRLSLLPENLFEVGHLCLRCNQLRVLMTAAAYVLMQELRFGLAGTACARAQVSTLRERFLKLGAQVVSSVRRIVLHRPQSFPDLDNFYRLAWRLGAQSG